MLKKTILGFGVLGLLLAGSAWVSGQTKPLKAVFPRLFVADETAPEAESADPLITLEPQIDPGANVQSYSVITENRIGPDGKRVQKKKVWQNGTLVEEKEEVIEGEDDQLSAEIDGQTFPGMISRSEQNGGFFGLPGNMDEMLRGMEENLQGMEDRMNALRAQILQGTDAGLAGAADAFDANGLLNQRDDVNARRAEILRRNGLAAPLALSEYWIGASVSPVSDDTAYQLGLADGEGLLVREVVTDSPAEKAGLQKYDILLEIGGQPVASAAQIGQIVDEAKDASLTVSYIRKGERQTAELTPEKRPAPETAAAENLQNFQQSFQQNLQQALPQREQIRVVRPGMIVPDESAESAGSAEPAEPAGEVALPQAEQQPKE